MTLLSDHINELVDILYREESKTHSGVYGIKIDGKWDGKTFARSRIGTPFYLSPTRQKVEEWARGKDENLSLEMDGHTVEIFPVSSGTRYLVNGQEVCRGRVRGAIRETVLAVLEEVINSRGLPLRKRIENRTLAPKEKPTWKKIVGRGRGKKGNPEPTFTLTEGGQIYFNVIAVNQFKLNRFKAFKFLQDDEERNLIGISFLTEVTEESRPFKIYTDKPKKRGSKERIPCNPFAIISVKREFCKAGITPTNRRIPCNFDSKEKVVSFNLTEGAPYIPVKRHSY